MKATDLMIGDYIQNLAGDLCQVIALDRQVAQVETLTGVHQGDTTRYLHEAEGVPLTPEILEKNGFEGDGYLWIDVDNVKTLVYYPFENRLTLEYGDKQEILFKCQCFSVHELQHALKLCGIKKEIVLQ